MLKADKIPNIQIHRHIGGLEMLRLLPVSHLFIHRHIGGLEMLSL